MPPDNETPAQTMARVSREIRSSAGPTIGGGYQADIGVSSGPLSGGVFAAGAPVSGQPQAAGANVGVGPLSAQFVQPTFKGAQPSYGVGFNPDEYFGANVMKTPQGMQYGVRAGPVSASYNPTRKDLSVMGGFERRFADGGPVLTSKRIAASFVPPEEQGAVSPSMEGVMEGAAAVGRGLGPALQATGEYITSTRPGQMVSDVGTLAGAMAQAAKENPAEFIGGMLPGIGNIYSLRDIDELKAKIAAARAAGDEETALKLEKFAPLAAVGAAAPFGAGAAVGAITKAAERAAVKGVARELSPIGLYSYGAEAASMLPQAKGTPEQMAAMLQKQGVKPVEMEGFAEAFAGKPSITAEEASAFFKEKMPVVEEKVLGSDKSQKLEVTENSDGSGYVVVNESGDVVLDGGRFGYGDPNTAAMAMERYISRGPVTSTKFSQYTLPGGENYREVLLKTPTPMNQYNSYVKELRDKYGQGGFDNLPLTEAERAKLDKLMNAAGDEGTGGTFRSGHWDEPNVLAHIRMADRTGPNGEKILHVEEIQSDWAQKGRKEGFKEPGEPSGLSADETARFRELTNIPQIRRTPAQQTELDALNATGDRRLKAPPSAPYVTSTQGWTDLALKRVLKEAAEGGYDKVVWTPGAEQAKRYKLSNQVKSIDYMKEGDDVYRLGVVDKNGEGINLPKDTFTAKELEEYLGKEVAEKIVKDEGKSYRGRNHKSLEGVDLEVGGEGMKGYYDKIVPTQLAKLTKKLDPEAKIGKDRLPVQNYTISAPDIARELGMTVDEVAALPHDQKMALINTVRHSIAAPSLTITPKMREAIMQGLPSYAEGGEVEAPTPTDAPAADTISVTENVMADIADSGLDRRQIATLLRMASTGTLAPDKAMEFADSILTGDIADMERRFQEYPRSMRILSRVDAAVGGENALGYGSTANRNPGGPLAYKAKPAGYAKGGVVKGVRRGGGSAFEEIKSYGMANFGDDIIKGMANRAGGDPAKLMFAMNQYTKNLAAQDPETYTPVYRDQIAAMNEIAQKYKINTRAAFRRDPAIPQTVGKIDEAMGAAKTPAFKQALQRMQQILGG